MVGETVVHCAVMCGLCYAIEESGKILYREKNQQGIDFFTSLEFSSYMKSLYGSFGWSLRIHEDSATPEMMEVCRKMEERKMDEVSAISENINNNSAESEEKKQELPSEHTAKDGEFCVVECQAESTESEDKLKRLIMSLESLKKEKSAVMKDYNGQIEDMETQLFDAAKGVSMTHQKAQVRFDWANGMKDFISLTGEILKSVQITDAEKQIKMDFDKTTQPEQSAEPQPQ